MDAWLDHLDEKERALAAFVGGTILFLVETGLQVSGITSLPLAIGLWGLAALLFLYWLSHFKWADTSASLGQCANSRPTHKDYRCNRRRWTSVLGRNGI